MKKGLASLLGVWCVWLLAACGGSSQKHAMNMQGDTLVWKYARHLSVVAYEDYMVAEVRNPWDTLRTLHTYVLVPDSLEVPLDLPKGTLVRTPLKRSLVYSAVHCGLMQDLGVLGALAGVCDLKYIRMESVHQAVKAQRVVDCGDAMQPDVERVIDLHPDAVLLSPFENSGGYGRIEKLNISLIECADYMETSALGRAEWMRFYGILFGVPELADSLFRQVEGRYLALKQRAALSSRRLSVISERKSGSAWYMPGGKSTVAGLYRDACADYPFADYPQSGSIPLAFETVFEKAGDADVWLIKYNSPRDLTYEELQSEFGGYASFKAFKQRNIYGCNTARVSFYEETPFHPDWLLSDFVQIFHPEWLEADSLRYFNRLP